MEDKIHEKYKRELRSFEMRRFRLPCCPVHVLLARTCGDCPAEGRCPGGNPGSALGIDHQTLTVNEDGIKRFTFRPYKTSFDGEKRELLAEFCEYFKMKLEVLDVNTYSAEVEGQTYTVHITPTEESLRFRRGGNVGGAPWYGKGSPLKRFWDAHQR